MILYYADICQASISTYHCLIGIDEGKMDNIREILAKNLRENRQKLNISQPKLAELANLSTHYIASIETSRKFPTPEVLEKLAGALGIETHELFLVSYSAKKELENLRNDIICEVKALNEKLAGEITEEIKSIKHIFLEENKKNK
jgi:transcriptional regulator with XRE-family HTH domain